MTARSGTWLKNNFMSRDPYDYNVDLVDSMGLWTDEFTIGEDGDGDDVIFYGDTAGSQLHWDADTDTLELDGTTPKFRLGDFSGSTAGEGSVLSAADSAAFRVYADDGGAAIGSGTLARAGVFRNLLTYTGGNREQEAAGVIGQIVSVSGTNRHNMAGTWGSYEARTALTVDGQAAATDTWAQAAIIARVGVGSGITTINTNGVLAGVAAMSNTASFAANNGVYAGYYVGAWSGAADWAYGMYMEGGKFTTGLAIGSCTTGIAITSASAYAIDIQTTGQFRMGEQGTGIPTATATPFAMEIHAETNADAVLSAGLTGLTCGIRCRYEISKAQTEQISFIALEGRLRPKAGMADGAHAGVSGTVEADGAVAFTGTATTQRSAGNFCVELGASCTFGATSGWLTGVTIDSSIHATQVGMTNITFPALRIKKSSGKLAWQYGIYMDADAAGRAWYSSNTMSGSAALSNFEIAATDTTTYSSGYGRAFYVGLTKSSGAVTSTGECSAAGIDATFAANVTNANAASIYTALSGSPTLGSLAGIYIYCDNKGTATINSSYQTLDLNIDTTSEATAGNHFIRMYSHGAAPTSAFYFPGSVGIDHLLYFAQDVAPVDGLTGETDGCTGHIAVLHGSTTKYLRLYSGVT